MTKRKKNSITSMSIYGAALAAAVNGTDKIATGTLKLSDSSDWTNIQKVFVQYRLISAKLQFVPATTGNGGGIIALWKTTNDEPATVAEFFEKVLKNQSQVSVGAIQKQHSFLYKLQDSARQWQDISVDDTILSYSWGMFSHVLQTTDIAGHLYAIVEIALR
jgi:hypothetical protein